MRICYLNMPIENYSPISGGAVSTVMMNQARELLLRGHEVFVLTRRCADPVYDVGRIVPIEVKERHELTFPERAISKLRMKVGRWDYAYYQYYRDSFMRALRSIRPSPDVVIVHNDVGSLRHIRRVSLNAALVVYMHNEQRTRQRHPEQEIRRADGVIAVSDYIRRWILEYYAPESTQVRSVLNGVDTEEFNPRNDWMEPRAAIKVLFVGRINQDKGPDIAVEAVSSLRREGFAVELTVIGDVWWYTRAGDAVDPFYIRLKEAMRNDGISHLGHVSRHAISSLMRDHDVLMVPSRWNDPCPLVPLEGMASGCAVIASRRGGIPDACGDAAILCDPDQAGDFTNALRELIGSYQDLNVRKKACRERAEQMTWCTNVDQLESFLAEAANKRRGSCPCVLNLS